MNEGDKELVFDLDNDEVIEGENSRLEQSIIEKIVRDDKMAWFYLEEVTFISFMECIEAHNEMVTWQVVNSWKKQCITIDGVTFEVMKELITNATGLSLEGKSWRKQPRVKDEVSPNSFFCSHKALVYFHGGFSREKLPKPWNMVFYIIICYITLEDRVKVF